MKRILRRAITWYARTGLKGGSRLLSLASPFLAPSSGIEASVVGQYSVMLDHRIRACRLMAYRLYEWEALNHIRRLVPKGGVVFDLGANVGYMAASFAEMVGSSGEVHFFEPSKQCRPFLEHLLKSGPEQLFRPNWVAVAERSRTGTFFETEATLSHGFARLDRKPTARFTDITHGEVSIVSLDDYIREHRVKRIDFIKIDVEGHELAVLQGMNQSFDCGYKPALLIEMTRGPVHDDDVRGVSDFLAHHNYSSFLPKGALLPVHWERLPKNFHDNILWLPNDSRSQPVSLV